MIKDKAIPLAQNSLQRKLNATLSCLIFYEKFPKLPTNLVIKLATMTRSCFVKIILEIL